jgi:hypothetical protein
MAGRYLGDRFQMTPPPRKMKNPKLPKMKVSITPDDYGIYDNVTITYGDLTAETTLHRGVTRSHPKIKKLMARLAHLPWRD